LVSFGLIHGVLNFAELYAKKKRMIFLQMLQFGCWLVLFHQKQGQFSGLSDCVDKKTIIIVLGDLFCGVGKDLPSKEDIWEIAGYSSKS
jgi:hypothetical protein